MVEIIQKIWGEEHWIVNRDYAGKKMVLYQGRQCSLHMHKVKDETFYINKGKVLIEVDGTRRIMYEGDSQLILPFQFHRFTAIGGDAEVFEFSTHHYDIEDTDNYRAINSRKIFVEEIINPDVYITGNRGYLGRVIAKTFERCGAQISGSDIETLDLTDFGLVNKVLDKIQPKCIIHTAALSDWKTCEKRPELAYKINVDVTQNLINYSKANNIPLIYISTDFVFDGKKDIYYDSDQPNPINVYGKSKTLAEERVRELSKHIILRAGTFYGISYLVDRPVFAHKVIRNLRKFQEYLVPTDEISNPTLIQDLAKCILFLKNEEMWGTHHVGGKEALTRFDFAKEIAQEFKLDKSLLKATTMKELGLSEIRPSSLILHKSDIFQKNESLFSSLELGLKNMYSDFLETQNLLPK